MLNRFDMYKKYGFTLVELLIAIAVIGILVTIVAVSYSAHQQNTRNAERASKAALIAEQLEKYFDENGEYPSCEAVTANGSTVRQNTLKDVAQDTLVAPKAASGTTNSIRCTDLTSSVSDDIFAYVGDTSSTCRTGAACSEWVLKYREEGSGDIISIHSRRSATQFEEQLARITATPVHVSQINVSWSAVQGAVSYQLQRSATSGFSSPTTTTHTTTSSSVTGLTPNTLYYFRVRVVYANQTGNWSDVVSARTAAIPTPTLSAAANGISTINTSWSSGAGVSSYQLQRSTTSSFTSPTTTTHTTTSSAATGLTPNTLYYFRVRAVAQGLSGNWSNVVSARTANVTAPTGTVTISAAMSGTNARGTAGGGSCASGTTIERQIRYNTNDGSWSAWTTGTPRDVAATQGYKYTFQSQARCTAGGVSSGWVTSGTASVTRPVIAPSGLTISAAMSGTNARGTAGGGSCASGTTIERQIRYQSTNSATAGSWSGWTTGTPRDVAANQGYRYTFQQQARCKGQNTNSGWVTSGSASVVRAISAPGAPSVSASTSGDTTTYRRGNVSCPTGTSARYQYKYLADWGYDSGWYGPTTSSSFTWGTSSQGYQYRMQVRAQCYTTHAASGWGGAGTGSYIRPVSAPGAISYGISRGGPRIAYVRAASSCHSSVGLYSRADVHTWDHVWNDTRVLGWYANSHGGRWVLHDWNYYGNPVQTGAQSQSVNYQSGSRWNIAVDLRCRNSQTGRASGTTGRRESPTMYLP